MYVIKGEVTVVGKVKVGDHGPQYFISVLNQYGKECKTMAPGVRRPFVGDFVSYKSSSITRKEDNAVWVSWPNKIEILEESGKRAWLAERREQELGKPSYWDEQFAPDEDEELTERLARKKEYADFESKSLQKIADTKSAFLRAALETALKNRQEGNADAPSLSPEMRDLAMEEIARRMEVE